MKYSFHPLARKELNEAIDYYNKCQDNLGFEFAIEVYTAIQLILQFPKAWSSLSKNTRRCLTNRFPYGIIYQEEKEEIIIIAIMQLNREPKYWHGRIK
jgi:plasmid stabilization system protein ParE